MSKFDIQTASILKLVSTYLADHVVTCLERDWHISMSGSDASLSSQEGGSHLTPHIFFFNPDVLGIYQTSK
jgi:hypothetical protein